MKKLLSFVTMLLSMTAVMAQTSETVKYNDEGYAEVWNAQQLKSVIQGNNSAKIQLMADIDAAKIGKLCDTFRGTITGKHKEFIDTLKKETDVMYTITGSRKNASVGDDKTDSWLFDKVDGATFDYIQFKDFRIEEDKILGGDLGMIAKEAVSSAFTNLNFENISIFEDDNNAGVIAGTATDCEFVFVTTKQSDVTVDGRCVGGLVGYSSNSRYAMCLISMTSAVYGDGSWGDARVGGVVGESKQDKFCGCINASLVGGGSDEIGGIAGSSTDSEFVSCNNEYAVIFCDEAGNNSSKVYFRNLVNKARETEASITLEQQKMIDSRIISYGTGIISGPAAAVIINSLIRTSSAACKIATGISYAEYANCVNVVNSLEDAMDVFNIGLKYAKECMYIVNDMSSLIQFSSFVAGMVVIAIVTVTIDAIILYTDYDDVGGICGFAEGSTFERCTNKGTLFSDDAFCGGIVGRAYACKINNCLNTGKAYNEGAQTLGGMVGYVLDQTKVTNCLSTKDYPIIGANDNSYLSHADAASGNNYRFENGKKSNYFETLEVQVKYAQLVDGTVANWLNNGAENLKLGIRPWRQKLSGDDLDKNPVLDEIHKEVMPVDLEHMTIRNEADLRAFAEEVNNGNSFCNAVLENDINMTSREAWTPIGTKAKHFRGVFDGQGHTISGLKCTVEADSQEGAGLFGSVDVHADIRNVTLDSSCMIENMSAYGAGAIVGTMRNDSYSWGTVVIRGCGNLGDVKGHQHIGGILGRVINNGYDANGDAVLVAVDNCFNAGSITANEHSALICGYMQNFGMVTNCWSGGSLQASGSNSEFNMENPTSEAEYFAGYNQTLDIRGCYDFKADVDWNDIEEAKQKQKGVTKNSDMEVTPDASLVYRRKVTVPEGEELAFGTICLPYTLIADDDLRFYTFKEGADIDGTMVFRFEDADTLQAGTPAMFSYTKSTNGLEFVSAGKTFNGIPKIYEDDEAKWKFVGTYEPVNLDEGKAYLLSYKNNLLKFRLNTAGNLGAFRAYITTDDMPMSLNSQEVSLMLDDYQPTAISRQETQIGQTDDATVYNIQGQRVTDSFKGIVIKGNKKYFIK